MSLEENEISKGSGSTPCYVVEARCVNHLGPKSIHGVIYTDKWKLVHFDKSPIPSCGVPNDPELTRHGLLDWATANALRWWFVASMKHECYDMETRIMERVLVHTYSIKEVKAHDEINHMFNRPKKPGEDKLVSKK